MSDSLGTLGKAHSTSRIQASKQQRWPPGRRTAIAMFFAIGIAFLFVLAHTWLVTKVLLPMHTPVGGSSRLQGGVALPTTSLITHATPQDGGSGWWDHHQWAIAALTAAFQWIEQGLISALLGFLQQVVGLDFITRTPPNLSYTLFG